MNHAMLRRSAGTQSTRSGITLYRCREWSSTGRTVSIYYNRWTMVLLCAVYWPVVDRCHAATGNAECGNSL